MDYCHKINIYLQKKLKVHFFQDLWDYLPQAEGLPMETFYPLPMCLIHIYFINGVINKVDTTTKLILRTNMGTISKVGLQIWSFLDFFGAFWATKTPQNFSKQNKIIGTIKADVWVEKCHISLKDQIISLKALIFFMLELFPVAWTMAYTKRVRVAINL